MATNPKQPAQSTAAPAAPPEIPRLEATRAELIAQLATVQAEASDFTLPAARMIEIRIRLSAIQSAIRSIDLEILPAKRRAILAKADAQDLIARDAAKMLESLRKQGYNELEREVSRVAAVYVEPSITDAQVEDAIDKFGRLLRMKAIFERTLLVMTSAQNNAAAWREDANSLERAMPKPALV